MSSSFKSIPQNRARTPKYQHRSSNNLYDTSQHDLESNTTSRAIPRRSNSASKIYYHHHQHHHYNNYYLTRNQSSSSNNNNSSICEIKKFLIYAIFLFLGYYLLFIVVTMTYNELQIFNSKQSPNPNGALIIDNDEIGSQTHYVHQGGYPWRSSPYKPTNANEQQLDPDTPTPSPTDKPS